MWKVIFDPKYGYYIGRTEVQNMSSGNSSVAFDLPVERVSEFYSTHEEAQSVLEWELEQLNEDRVCTLK